MTQYEAHNCYCINGRHLYKGDPNPSEVFQGVVPMYSNRTLTDRVSRVRTVVLAQCAKARKDNTCHDD